MLRHIYRYWSRHRVNYYRIRAMIGYWTKTIYLFRYHIEFDEHGSKLYKIPRKRVIDGRK